MNIQGENVVTSNLPIAPASAVSRRLIKVLKTMLLKSLGVIAVLLRGSKQVCIVVFVHSVGVPIKIISMSASFISNTSVQKRLFIDSIISHAWLITLYREQPNSQRYSAFVYPSKFGHWSFRCIKMTFGPFID